MPEDTASSWRQWFLFYDYEDNIQITTSDDCDICNINDINETIQVYPHLYPL